MRARRRGARALWDDAVRAHQRGDAAAAHAATPPCSRAARIRARRTSARRRSPRRRRSRCRARRLCGRARRGAGVRRCARRRGSAPRPTRTTATRPSRCARRGSRARRTASAVARAGARRSSRRDGAEAAAAFERALALDPDDGETHYNHGVALQMQRSFTDAARAYQRALAFGPTLVDADFNLGVLFQQQGALDAAIRAYRNGAGARSGHVIAYKNLGEALFAAGEVRRMARELRALRGELSGRAAARRPGPRSVPVPRRFRASSSATSKGCATRLSGRERAAARRLPRGASLPAALLRRRAGDDAASSRRPTTWSAQRVYGEPLPRAASAGPGRLRIGYLSADLRNHVMGKMIWQAVAHHDTRASSSASIRCRSESDEWTERFAASPTASR